MQGKKSNLDLEFYSGSAALHFIECTRDGVIPSRTEDRGLRTEYSDQIEVCAFGARGDGKTIAALSAMIAHAQRHYAAGYSLPVRWIGVRDTFTNHRLTTCNTLLKPMWKNCWAGEDGGHKWFARGGGSVLVELDLMGLEDQSAKEKLKVECVGVWFEEIAPSAQGGSVNSGGIDEESWMLAQSSKRLPSHAHPGIATTNLPDDDHWSWRHFITNPPPRAYGIRIPPGERASAEFRAMLAEQYKDRPDLRKKLLDGEPGTTLLGNPVALGFSYDRHVSASRLVPLASGLEICLGFDGGQTPSCTIGQQLENGQINIFASLTVKGGMKQLIEYEVEPWLSRNIPWLLKNPELMLIGHDPSLGSDNDSDADKPSLYEIQSHFPDAALETPGTNQWPVRREVLLNALSRQYSILLDPQGCDGLIKALNGRWYYPKQHASDGNKSDIPKKPNHPWEDLGDSLIELLRRYGISSFSAKGNQYRVETNIDYDWVKF